MLTHLRDRAAIQAASHQRAWDALAVAELGDLVEIHGCEADLAYRPDGRATLWLRPVPGEQGGACIDADATHITAWLLGFVAAIRCARCERKAVAS